MKLGEIFAKLFVSVVHSVYTRNSFTQTQTLYLTPFDKIGSKIRTNAHLSNNSNSASRSKEHVTNRLQILSYLLVTN